MEKHGQSSLCSFIDFISVFAVNVEFLKIRMKFYSLESHFDHSVYLIAYVFVIGVHCSERKKFAVELCFLHDKIIDAFNL